VGKKENFKCSKCGKISGIENLKSISYTLFKCYDCYYGFNKNNSKNITKEFFGKIPMDNISDEEFDKLMKEI